MGFSGGGNAKSGSAVIDVVDLLSSPSTVSGGEGGNCCIVFEAACCCGCGADGGGRGTPAGCCVATLMINGSNDTLQC